MRKILYLSIIACMAFSKASFASSEIPKFVDYPAVSFAGPTRPVDLSTASAWYSEQIATLASGEMNFAGKYELIELSAGTGCKTAAVVDLSNGRVAELGVAACFWAASDQPFYFKSNSSLLVLAGKMGEGGPDGAHFYSFDGDRFIYILTRTRGGQVVLPEIVEDPMEDLPGNALASRPGMAESEEVEVDDKFDTDAGTQKLLACYSDGMERELDILSSEAFQYAQQNSVSYRNAFKANYLSVGGFLGLGKLIRDDCDRGFLAEYPNEDAISIALVSGAIFDGIIVGMEENFSDSCLSDVDNDGLRETIEKHCAITANVIGSGK